MSQLPLRPHMPTVPKEGPLLLYDKIFPGETKQLKLGSHDRLAVQLREGVAQRSIGEGVVT